MKATGLYQVKVRVPGGAWEVIRHGNNVITNYGLNAWSSELGGLYTPPGYLTLDAAHTTPTVAYSAGVSSISTVAKAHVTGDAQLIFGYGLLSQEVVTFSSVAGTGPYVYALTAPTANAHLITDIIVRQVQISDTSASVITAVQYDSVNDPTHWPSTSGTYQSGVGQYTLQFYFQAGQCPSYVAAAGLIDNQAIGSGNLHNHFLVGYDNSAGISDMEIDSVITFVNG